MQLQVVGELASIILDFTQIRFKLSFAGLVPMGLGSCNIFAEDVGSVLSDS